MSMRVKTPLFEDPAVIEHSTHIIASYDSVFGASLLGRQFYSAAAMAKSLYHAPFTVVAHNVDNVFNYGNAQALFMFKKNRDELIGMESYKTVSELDRGTRERLLQGVYQFGFVDNYKGVRVAGDGSLLEITDVRIWNVTNHEGAFIGQAAMIPHWHHL
jgi:PAS domain-containing protein